jgi:hypothetical protein
MLNHPWSTPAALLLAALSCPPLLAAPVVLSNASTELVVNGGEAGNGLVPYDGYFRYTDRAANEETTWSVDPLLRFANGSTAVLSAGGASGLGSATLAGGGAESSAVSGGISTSARTELIGSNARTTFTFTAAPGARLDGTHFVFYAENDLFGFDNDFAAFQGSIAGGNLALFQYDSAAGGLTVRMTAETAGGAALSRFGSGLWTGFGTALEGGDLDVLSSDGSNFVTLGDLGLAMSFALSGNTATVVINYDTQPLPPGVPEPSGLALVALAALLAGRQLRQR